MNRLILALAAICAFSPAAFADNSATLSRNDIIGTILSIEGKVTLTPQSGQNAAQAYLNMPVHPGDVVKTGSGARAFVQMIDNTELTLGENAQMSVDDYAFNDRAYTGNHAVYSIAKGAFLFVDGLLGKSQNPDVKVNIPVGTIGIRGTKFWGGQVDGKYGVIVGEGKVLVSNARGSIALSKGQATTIASINTAPDQTQSWAPDKIKRATDTVALKDTAAIGQRLQDNVERNQTLRQNHDQILQQREQLLKQKMPQGKTDTLQNQTQRTLNAPTSSVTPSVTTTPATTSVTLGGTTLSVPAATSTLGNAPVVQSAEPAVSTVKSTVTDTVGTTAATVKDAVKDTGNAVKSSVAKTLEKTNALVIKKAN